MPHPYTPFVEQCPEVNSAGYVDEVSVTSGGILGPESGGEICWNTILTDADLELCKSLTACRENCSHAARKLLIHCSLTARTCRSRPHTGQVVHTSSDTNVCIAPGNTTTTQLTAVEPHGLHLAQIKSSPGKITTRPRTCVCICAHHIPSSRSLGTVMDEESYNAYDEVN